MIHSSSVQPKVQKPKGLCNWQMTRKEPLSKTAILYKVKRTMEYKHFLILP